MNFFKGTSLFQVEGLLSCTRFTNRILRFSHRDFTAPVEEIISSHFLEPFRSSREKNPLEGESKIAVEDRVYDGVERRVAVPQPEDDGE